MEELQFTRHKFLLVTERMLKIGAELLKLSLK